MSTRSLCCKRYSWPFYLSSYFGLSSISLSSVVHFILIVSHICRLHPTAPLLPHPLLHVVSPNAPFSTLFCSIYTQPHLVLSSAIPPYLIYYTRMIHSFLSHLLPKTFLLSSHIYSQPFDLFHPGCHQIAELLIHLKLNFFSLASLNKHPKLSTPRSLYPMLKISVSSSTQPFPFLSRSPPFQVPVTTIYVIFGASDTL